MKIRIERDALAEAVGYVSKLVQARNIGAAGDGVLLVAEDDAVTVAASDYEQVGKVRLGAVVDEPGSAVIKGRLLADIARSLPNKPVSMYLEGSRLGLRCGRAEFALATKPREDYPGIPELPPLAGTVPGDLLAEAVGQVERATSREDTLPVLTGIRIEMAGERLTLAATDRYRLAVRTLAWNPEDPDFTAGLVARGKTLADLVKPLSGVEQVELSVDADHTQLGVSGGNRRSMMKLLDAKYPDFRSLLPNSSSTVATLDTSDFIEAVKRVRLVAEATMPHVRMKFADGALVMHAGSGEDSLASEEVECSIDGDAMQIQFDGNYLLDGLQSLDSEQARLQMRSESKPAVITSGDDDAADFQYLLMPVAGSGRR